MKKEITIIGAGLAGCEAAWQAARYGIHVNFVEMKPERFTPAHSFGGFAELVCSNSLGSDNLENGKGLLKQELRVLGSLVVDCADRTRVPAGSALAVDRAAFSEMVTEKVTTNKNISLVCREAKKIPLGEPVIVASGPLTAPDLAESIESLLGQGRLYFYDAASPIVEAESINFEHAFLASRYDKGGADYINCPMNEEQYTVFISELLAAEKAEVRGFEDVALFEACMPVESLAARGADTLRFGPLKPKGLLDPATGREPYAVVQLRQDNLDGTMYNIVGFQTRLKWGEQRRVFGLIPALADAKYARYGMMHRNTYINSPNLLDARFSLRGREMLYFAGQITGVEGYVESIASGYTAGLNLAMELIGKDEVVFPGETMIGALARYISSYSGGRFQPMNANFGIVDYKAPIKMKKRGFNKREKYNSIAQNSISVLKGIAENLSIERQTLDGIAENITLGR